MSEGFSWSKVLAEMEGGEGGKAVQTLEASKPEPQLSQQAAVEQEVEPNAEQDQLGDDATLASDEELLGAPESAGESSTSDNPFLGESLAPAPASDLPIVDLLSLPHAAPPPEPQEQPQSVIEEPPAPEVQVPADPEPIAQVEEPSVEPAIVTRAPAEEPTMPLVSQVHPDAELMEPPQAEEPRMPLADDVVRSAPPVPSIPTPDASAANFKGEKKASPSATIEEPRQATEPKRGATAEKQGSEPKTPPKKLEVKTAKPKVIEEPKKKGLLPGLLRKVKGSTKGEVQEPMQDVAPPAAQSEPEPPAASKLDVPAAPAPQPQPTSAPAETKQDKEPKQRLGHMLLAQKLINQDELLQALEVQKKSNEPLGRILLRSGFISEEKLLRALAAQKGVSSWHLERETPAPEAVQRLSPEICKTYFVLPVKLRGDLMVLAMRNPEDMAAIEVVRNATGLRIEPVLADEDRLGRTIESIHGVMASKDSMDGLVSEALKDVKNDPVLKRERAVLSEADTRPVVGLVNQILSDAIRMHASDVHIEPRMDRVDIRYRIDGQLQKVREIPPDLMPMLSTRLKIMSELDIVEWRVPQDGRVSVAIDNRSVDLRVSVLPNYHGQRFVLRILDRSVSVKQLDDLGFTEQNLALFRALIHKPYGMFLVTGPTGSGKTTTLYGGLSELRQISNNIMTCEDPVEYEIDGVNQSQVNEKVGLTFATQLRAILRQDPDIILVGEIRDQETAETAIRAALTGHLVLSTLHCNDAPSAIPRLLDMGIDPYLLSTSLIGVMSQRLLRVLCPHCRKVSKKDGELLAAHLDPDVVPKVYEPKGCTKCHNTGFKGRIAVHEILPVTSAVAGAIGSHATIDVLQELGAKAGYRPMQVDAISRVLAGTTSLSEAQRQVFFDFLPQLGSADLKAAA